MFARSAAGDTLQGQAMQAANARWGQDTLGRAGRETLGIPVCKKKYKPFSFQIKRLNGTYQVHVQRLYACRCHDGRRRAVIAEHGLRPGWEPFGQWSLRKAQEMARAEAARLNAGEVLPAAESDDSTTTEEEEEEEEASYCGMGPSKVSFSSDMCANGRCHWKLKSAYDDIYKEIHGVSDPEDNESG